MDIPPLAHHLALEHSCPANVSNLSLMSTAPEERRICRAKIFDDICVVAFSPTVPEIAHDKMIPQGPSSIF